MLKLKVEEMKRPGDWGHHTQKWRVKATLCGSYMAPGASDWVYGDTRPMAIKKLKTHLRKCWKKMGAARDRICTCYELARMALGAK